MKMATYLHTDFCCATSQIFHFLKNTAMPPWLWQRQSMPLLLTHWSWISKTMLELELAKR